MSFNFLNRKTNSAIALIVLWTVYTFLDCNSFFFIEYIKYKFQNYESFKTLMINTQFVSDTFQNTRCYLTVTETIFNQYGQPELIKIFLPREARVLLQQILITFTIYLVLFNNSEKKFNPTKLNASYFFLAITGLFLNYYLTSIYVDFETNYYKTIFIFFSLVKSYFAYKFLKLQLFEFKVFLLLLFPLFSTGFGFSWMFDFIVYYFLFYIFTNSMKFHNNKKFFLIVFVLCISLLAPLLNSPSLENLIIESPSEFNNIIDNVNVETSKNTFLEKQDIRYLKENITNLNQDEVSKTIYKLSKNIKGTDYPNRWGIMVAFLPDLRYHLPSFFWIISVSFLFLKIIESIKVIKFDKFTREMQQNSNLLIIYPLLSIFLGINYFFNSFSDFLFFLTRKSEIIDFGEVQTWRGINTHYEVFGNLQLFCVCFFLLNFYLNKSNKNFIYILISCTTTLLSQSRFTSLILFIILFITCAFFFKAFKKEYLVLALLVFSFSQIVPTFEREDPFFIVDSELIEVDDSQSDNYGFEFISDRLNRTLPWTMFASGYNPNKVELFFGHGSGSYLNIIKFTEEDIASGPHSLILQLLNKFGLLGLFTFFYLIIKYLFSILNLANLKQLHIFIVFLIFTLLLSLEFKTDSFMLVDGFAIFLFNLLLGTLFRKIQLNKLLS